MTDENKPKKQKIPSLLSNCSSDDPEHIKQVSQIKRVLELWTIDPGYKNAFNEDSGQALRSIGVSLRPSEITPFINADEATALQKAELEDRDSSYPISVRRYRSFISEKQKMRSTIRENCQPCNSDFSAWRYRQIHRCFSEFGYKKADAIIHSPVAFELSKGCSVGCWFCALDPGKLSKIWSYTEENGIMWRKVLQAVKDIIGPAARYSPCYHATEPLDNPDYEQFISDFHQVFEQCPQTTTAASTRDINRTRRLLELARQLDSHIDRFSILSTDMLHKIHSSFTPEELLRVELLPQNVDADSKYLKANAGRANQHKDHEKYKDNIQQKNSGSTIACITGFLVNMPDKEVKLITPCNSSQEWPLGYKVLDQGLFETPDDFRVLLNGMCQRNMTAWLKVDDPIRLRPDLIWEASTDSYSIQSPSLSFTFKKEAHSQDLEKLICRGDLTAFEIALNLEKENNVDMKKTFLILNEFFSKGLLCEPRRL